MTFLIGAQHARSLDTGITVPHFVPLLNICYAGEAESLRKARQSCWDCSYSSQLLAPMERRYLSRPLNRRRRLHSRLPRTPEPLTRFQRTSGPTSKCCHFRRRRRRTTLLVLRSLRRDTLPLAVSLLALCTIADTTQRTISAACDADLDIMPRKSTAKRATERWRIRRDVDLAALLAVAAAIWQFHLWTLGAQVRVFPPSAVALYQQDDGAGKRMVRIAAQVAYANQAQETYGSAVVDERATLELLDLEATEKWNGFGSITTASDGSYQINWSNETAQPAPLPGHSAASRFVLFATADDPKKCAERCDMITNELRPQELLSRVRAGSTLKLRIQIEDADGKLHRAACARVLDQQAITELKELFKEPPSVSYIRCGPLKEGRSWLARLWRA